MHHCRLCKAKFPKYTMPADLLDAIGGRVSTDICPACMDLASKKSGIVLSWSASFGEAASTANSIQQDSPTRPVSLVSQGGNGSPQTYSSDWQTCPACKTLTLLNGRCINPSHDLD